MRMLQILCFLLSTQLPHSPFFYLTAILLTSCFKTTFRLVDLYRVGRCIGQPRGSLVTEANEFCKKTIFFSFLLFRFQWFARNQPDVIVTIIMKKRTKNKPVAKIKVVFFAGTTLAGDDNSRVIVNLNKICYGLESP